MQTGQQLGPFTIEKQVGEGAMGTVYRARHDKTGQAVALKIISGADITPNTIARFERETAILKKLNHPNIVRLLATGRIRGTPFYVMEFIEGETLEALLERRGRFTWQEVVALGKQVCAALQEAHRQGIIHRDLKPANVMMTSDGTAKLTDFGIAKGLEVSKLTATHATVGTAAYMSPEQCRGEKSLTGKSDLYSLGVMFYELLTGRRPFHAETTLDMFLQHTDGKFERPSRQVLDIPIWLDTLVCHLLEKEPGKRPYDAAMVAHALDEVLEKVSAQKSAGVEAATTRRIDRARMPTRVDATDRETAKLLRTATTGIHRAKKKRRKPVYERGWFVISAVALLLLGVGGVVYKAMAPPPPEQLVQKARKLMESGSDDDVLKARQDPIAKYLAYYADRNDEDAAQVHRWADQIDLDQRERALRNRMRINLTPDGSMEPLAFRGIRAEDAGDFDTARGEWQKLSAKSKESPETDAHSFELVAEKHLVMLEAAIDLESQLQKEVEKAATTTGAKADDPESRARFGARAEAFKDYSLALDEWEKVKHAVAGGDVKRPLALLASRKVRDLSTLAVRGPEAKGVRLEFLRKKLADANAAKAEKPEEAQRICQELVALYSPQRDKDQEIGAMVDQAEQILKSMRAAAPAVKDVPAAPK
jgi:serine/threonine-protein kinase